MKLVFVLIIHVAAFYSCKNSPAPSPSEESSNIEIIDETSSPDEMETGEHTDTVISLEQAEDIRQDIQDEGREKTLPRPEPKEQTEKLEQVPVGESGENKYEIQDEREPESPPRVEPEEETEKVVVEKTKDERQKTQDGVDHSQFDDLLQEFVSSKGKVNYNGFRSDSKKLAEYLGMLESTDVDKLNSREQLAFWINAYNAYTIRLILDNYPVNSIMDLDGGKVWDRKWIKLDGRTLSLNNIENDIIRPEFKESRIHFAVNCAARSCPPLANKAWKAGNMESMFEKQTKSFINNKTYNDISKSRIRLSRIFEWYASDFGNIIQYINKYSDTQVESDAKVEYLEYDWSLNN